MPHITLRPIEPDDLPVLLAVYASTRADELAPLGWGAEQQAIFVQQQFTAQHQYYQEHYTDASFQVILIDGEPAGRLYVARWPREIRLIDIALLPAYRGLGVGTSLLNDLFDEAVAARKPIRIHVEKFNPALRLYQRLGFVSIEDRGVYWFMEWAPSVAHQPAASLRVFAAVAG